MESEAMTGLSRCGRRYLTFDEAYRAAEARTFKTQRKHVATGCPFDTDHFHVVPFRQVIGKPKPPRLDPFPPIVARLVDKRDEGLCQRCGRETRLERHHRRAKSMGGSKARSHTQCPCNALSLCRGCHSYVHEHPTVARLYGQIVSQAVARPGAVAAVRYFMDLNYPADEQWATCDGRWVHSPSEAED